MRHAGVVEFGYWPPQKHRSLRSHRNDGLEIVLIRRGELLWQVEGRAEPVPAGSVFFTWPWETHGSVRQSEPGCELYYVVLRLDRPYPRASLRPGLHPAIECSKAVVAYVREKLLSLDRRAWPATHRLTTLLPMLVEELARADADDSAVASLARLVLIELIRSTTGEPRSPRLPAARERVKSFVGRLAAECDRAWSLAEMASVCHLGRSRFSSILFDLTGDTPRMVLNRLRVERATSLLRSTDWPITRIAMECGFSNSQHFANVFRQYAGHPASTLRSRAGRPALGSATSQQ